MRSVLLRSSLCFFAVTSLFLSALAQPSNNTCANATPLTSRTTCSNVNATVGGATSSGNSTNSGTVRYDVWFRFTALSMNPTITLSSIGANLSAQSPRIELFSSCALTSTLGASAGTTYTASNLTIGTTYYFRVFSNTTNAVPTTANTFNVCVTDRAGGRMGEAFQQTILSAANVLNDPWEVTYGADNMLWVTEAKGYRVYRIDPNTGTRTTVLDISNGSTFLTVSERPFNVQFASNFSPWPQGGLAGLALHPQFMAPSSPQNFVYLSYVHTYNSTAANNSGVFFTNRLVRWFYNTSTGRLEQPVSLCDTLPGSSDHNSQRMIIAPVNGVNYLFYASGDMGSGQFGNANRAIKSQITPSYEGKILRFNLDSTGTGTGLSKWIPEDNPFNALPAKSAVWATGMRNNQGFAYLNIGGTDLLYGSSHGPFSDDEVNIIEKGMNYGHPLVIGYSSDNNYNNCKAGSSTGSLPLITNESGNATALGASYRNPIFSAYAAPQATVYNIYTTNPGNGGWPSEGWSGMDVYTHTAIPGWKNSLVLGSLKWGRLIRLKLNTAGTGIVSSAGSDTVSYFGSQNRFRDIAFAPNGRDLFVVMDRSTTTSGPSSANPVVPACQGCLQKYTFMGYHSDATGRSAISTAIPVSTGTAGTCVNGTGVTIDASNSNLWVPITGPDGNIVAEIRANGNLLGNVSTSFFTRNGTLREDASRRLFLNRSITITPQNQPSSAVSVRLYLTAAELAAIVGVNNSQGTPSNVTSVSDLRILKTNEACGPTVSGTGSWITPAFADEHNTDAYVLQADITSFSTFHFSSQAMIILSQQLVSFKGVLRNGQTLLNWETLNEQQTQRFEVERSLDGINFTRIGSVDARGAGATRTTDYQFVDVEAGTQPVNRLHYRLRILDTRGEVSYSRIVTVVLEPALQALTVYPNPAQDWLKLRLNMTQPGNLRLQVIDQQGRVLFQQARYMTAGQQEWSVDVRSWSAQVLTVQLVTPNGEIVGSRQVVKQ